MMKHYTMQPEGINWKKKHNTFIGKIRENNIHLPMRGSFNSPEPRQIDLCRAREYRRFPPSTQSPGDTRRFRIESNIIVFRYLLTVTDEDINYVNFVYFYDCSTLFINPDVLLLTHETEIIGRSCFFSSFFLFYEGCVCVCMRVSINRSVCLFIYA